MVRGPLVATTAAMSGARSGAVLDRLSLALLVAFVASLQVSIALADILLGATLLVWVAVLLRAGVRPSAPRFFVPLLVYAGLTLVASAFSIDAAESFADDKQVLLLLVVPAVYDLARGRRAFKVLDVIVTVGAASAVVGIVQYGLLHYDNLGRRPDGALTHYMTYSGVLMLVICAAAARLVFGSRDRTWPALVMPALVVALAVTLTRSALVGAAVAVGLLFALRDLRLTALLPVAMAVALAMAPDSITTRMMSAFDLQDPSSRDRVEMLRIGAGIVRDYPLTGVGPNMVPRIYPEYRGPDAVNRVNPHLHNVPMQIAAERGLPALGAWIWFVVLLTTTLFRLFRSAPATGEVPPGGSSAGDRVLPAAGLAAVAAMLAAGLFEYNFGDSEFLMLFLVMATLPFAAARGD
jgi:hypothetical protein